MARRPAGVVELDLHKASKYLWRVYLFGSVEHDQYGEMEGYMGGYTPAFTLKGLFIQFLSFFSSEQVEQEHGPPVYIGGRFHKVFVPMWEFRGARINTFVGSNDSPASAPRRFDDAAYMAEFEDGGYEERVLERHYTQQGCEGLVTVWRPNASGPFANVKITWESNRFLETRRESHYFICEECEYGTASMPRTVPVEVPEEYMDQGSPFREDMEWGISSNVREIMGLRWGLPEVKKQSSSKAKICYLGILNDDVLLDIAKALPSESLINFGKAFPRMRELTTHHHILLQRELCCFFLRTPLHTPFNLLGVGVHVNGEAGTLESSFDWLSMDAFEKFKVRKSVDKKPFEFFLPLGFSPAHFDRAYSSNKLFEYLDLIDTTNTRRRGGPGPGNTLFALNSAERRINVLYRFCNSIVVSLMRATDELYSDGAVGGAGGAGKAGKTLLFASEKACIGYLQIYHLLLCIMRREPELRRRALERIKAFCAEDRNRSKSSVPDLGEFIVMAAVVAGSDSPASAVKPTLASFGGGRRAEAEESWGISGQRRRQLERTGSSTSWAAVAAGRGNPVSAVKPTLASFNGGRRTEAEEGWSMAGQRRHQVERTGSSISWRTHLVGPFTDEVFTRNVRWAIQKYSTLANKYSVEPSERVRKTFDASRTSLRLVMFQVFFLETFTAEHITRQMDRQYGFAGPEVPAMITRGIKEIYEVNGYKQFCERVGFKGAVGSGLWTEAMSRVLLAAVERSEMKGYHRAHWGRG
ncbi:uncharacterized protein LAJ45_09968 [Morchella importuna]|uniref:uncharacterized protein n=1 Tax=Morchella importuna TaxID=1174673 RepID=UPI001E8DFAC1|nr:uncharacterized protein LAJ45_09968 [Morchella importuna]KAH8146046.1 hypothetical protein LAJ45_09968 [Morchella importuna]